MAHIYFTKFHTYINTPAHTSKDLQLHHWSEPSQLDYLISIKEVSMATAVTKTLKLHAFLQRLVSRLCFLPSYSACSVMTRCQSPSRYDTESKLFVWCVLACMHACACVCLHVFAYVNVHVCVCMCLLVCTCASLRMWVFR